MIRKLHIENFRCLRNVEINLEPLTVFVGANAAGKSSVFSALHSARTSGWRDADRSASNGMAPIAVTVHDEAAVLGQRQFVGSRATGTQAFPESQILQLDLNELRKANTLTATRRLRTNGDGLANTFATLTRREQDEIAQQLRTLVPMYADVGARPHDQGTHWIVFQDQWHKERWYEPHEVSDGTILLLAYLLLPYQAPPPDIVAIEEPERGLHPYLMGRLVDTLRKLAKGELGPRRSQILLATHSADLLEFVEPKEVRFFSRSKDTGETRVEQAPVDNPNWLKAMREYDNSLGDLWLSGSLGGVPGS